jgi:hypothetical protein
MTLETNEFDYSTNSIQATSGLGTDASTISVSTYGSTQYMWTNPYIITSATYLGETGLIQKLFSNEEIELWLKENGFELYYPDGTINYSSMQYFIDQMEQRLKSFLLSPKMKLNIKLPEGGDKW